MSKLCVLQNSGDVKNEVFEKKIAFSVFSFFYVGDIETENRKKRKWKRPKNPIIIFFKVVIQKCEKWIFSKNCVRKGEKPRVFVYTICSGLKCLFVPKQCKAGNAIKNRGFSGNCKKQK